MKKLQNLITSTAFQRFVNKRLVSAVFGWFADRKLPAFKMKKLLNGFIAAFRVDIDAFDISPDEVKTFNEFFRRKYKPGLLRFNGKIAAFADGTPYASGKINSGFIHVKGKNYSLHEIFKTSERISYNSYLSVYLSLADYHRVHFPFDAIVQTILRIDGTLYSLSDTSLHNFDKVYCKNERIILQGIWQGGKFAMILVGALVVGRIRLSFWTDGLKSGELYHAGVHVKQGDEAGYFEMGSTVILLLDSDELEKLNFKSDKHLKTGDALC